MILFNGSKTYGHVIQVMDEGLKVVDDQNQVIKLNPKLIDKKLEKNRSMTARDSSNCIL